MDAVKVKLGKRYRQIVKEWVDEISRKYPQVEFEGVEPSPEGGVAIKLRGPEDVLMLVIHEYADKKIEAALKHRCDILFAPVLEPPIDPNWHDWEIGGHDEEIKVMTPKGGNKHGKCR